MRTVFMGTPQFAAECLRSVLNSRHTVVAAVTQPDRPRGRHRTPEPSPVKLLTQEHQVPVLQPEQVNRRAVRQQIFEFSPDLIVVAAFGQLLHEEYLSRPPHGAINVHASLLPRHRGASPVQAAILAGDAVTGVSIQRMVEEMDAGDILRSVSTAIAEQEAASELERRLAKLGAEALLITLDEIEGGRARGQPQNRSEVTFAPKLAKSDGLIDWSLPADYLARFVRAMTDWPGAFTFWAASGRGPQRLVVWRAEPCGVSASAEPGGIVEASEGGIVVAAGSGGLRITRLQLQGKLPMPAADFLRGQPVLPGQILGAV